MRESFSNFKKRVKKKKSLEVFKILSPLYRKISIPISYLLFKTKITANQVSILNIFIGCVGCLLLILPSYWILAGVILQIYVILDHVDGELARAKKQMSEKGYFLDNLAHYLMKGLLPLSMSLGLYNLYSDNRILVMGILLVFFILTEHLLAYVNIVRRLKCESEN